MYLVNLNHKYHYETENLLRLFFPEKIVQSDSLPEGEDGVITSLDGNVAEVTVVLGGEKKSLKKEYSEEDIPSYDTNESFFESIILHFKKILKIIYFYI